MNEDELFSDLIALGAVKFMGYDPKTNEKMYSFTPRIKDLMPEIYKEHLNSVNKEVMKLWEKGFVDLDLLSEDPLISLTEKALDDFEISKLSASEQWSLNEIMRVLSERNI